MGTTSLEGQSLGEFLIVSKLASGGMGTVYSAWQASLNRHVVVKVLPAHLAADEKFVARFQREATCAATFSHPGIVQVYSAGESGGVHYIAMELVEGESLADRLAREGRIAPRHALAIAADVARALSYAWEKSRMIHRDVKPRNILLATDACVKVVDFGMVKFLDTEEQMTSTGVLLGTPHYISPEQANGRKDADFRADIYSLGCTLYQILSGHLPYEQKEGMGVVLSHVNDPPPEILDVMPDCPSAIVALLRKMLDKDPAQRHQSYAELIAELTAAARRLPAPALPRQSRWPLYATLGALMIITVAGLLLWSPWKNRAPKPIQPGQPFVAATGMELLYIPPGEFQLGSTPEERVWAESSGSGDPVFLDREGYKPQKVQISKGFWLGRTEVTVAQWQQFVEATRFVTEAEKLGHAFAPSGSNDSSASSWRIIDGANWRDPKLGSALQPDHPVSCVSWADAMAFCNWLTEVEQKAGRLPHGMVYRLPTEAEWEYAARGGRATRFWWGDEVEEGQGRLNWRGTDDGFETLMPVDHFDSGGRNTFGLADMLGNVWEWCLDHYDPGGAHADLYRAQGNRYVMRGGSFLHQVAYNRCAARPGFGPDIPQACTGFRVCCGVEPKPESQ